MGGVVQKDGCPIGYATRIVHLRDSVFAHGSEIFGVPPNVK